ncbi:MAG: SDR family NAD(P)-dependent oxidoreductase [Bacteroidota bacterium]|jgi:NAD(P)-dependent dehydrogenase (short-subunit alcohol dehydrogenase family)
MPLNPPISDWTGRRCWLIGASSGIGAATARLLLDRGARVAVSARNRAALGEVIAGRPDALAFAADVTRPESLAAARTAIEGAWGGVDLVILLAGAYVPVRAWELTVEKARSHVEVNLMGVYNALAAVLPGFLERRAGGIAIVSSVAGYRGLPKALVYGPTKAALINLAEVLYLDLAPRGVAVYVVDPGFVATPMTAQNEFTMPALLTPEVAAAEIVKGLERGRFEIHFPKRFTLWLKLLRLLPYRLYFALVRRSTGL